MRTSLGVILYQNNICLLINERRNEESYIRIEQSSDGFHFKELPSAHKLTVQQEEILQNTNKLRGSLVNNKLVLTIQTATNKTSVYAVKTKSIEVWEEIVKLREMNDFGVIVPDFKYNNQILMYAGQKDNLYIATSNDDLKNFKQSLTPVLKPRSDCFDHSPLSIEAAFHTHSGILVFYSCNKKDPSDSNYIIGACLMDPKNPSKVLWRSEKAIWEQAWEYKGKNITPLGMIYHNNKFISYFDIDSQRVDAVVYQLPHIQFPTKTKTPLTNFVTKLAHNPLIKPLIKNPWESKATFNPGALYDGEKVHIVYRAIGDSDTSVLGYASSRDGINIDERSDQPIYIPKEVFDTPVANAQPFAEPFSSGGGYGGCEDPRLTKIGNTVYLTYVAYDGASPPRVAITSISYEDFKNKKWNWDNAKIISKSNPINKNAVLLSEKINGKFVMFHRIFPNILIDFLDDLEFSDNPYLEGHFKIGPRPSFWDSKKVGAGAPPLKTEDGWLLIYHAVGNQDPGRYKIGAMLLDLEDPTKEIARSYIPIIEPVLHYENNGHKAGVVYPCGAVIVNDNLIIYYGGADTFTCAAVAYLPKFLRSLKQHKSVKLEPVNTPANYARLNYA